MFGIILTEVELIVIFGDVNETIFLGFKQARRTIKGQRASTRPAPSTRQEPLSVISSFPSFLPLPLAATFLESVELRFF